MPSPRLHSPSPRLGAWLSLGSPAIAEMAGLAGFDWALIDLEHGCETEAALPDQLRALRGTACQPIVRVGAPHPDLIARALDWGAAGIMAPRVESARAAERLAQAAFHAPRGCRGYSRTTPARHYGFRAETGSSPVMMAQIETATGVDKAAEIAAVEGVEVLFVGPADLDFDLKARRSARSFEDCVASVAAAAADQGKASGILVRDPSKLPGWRELGFTWLALGSDLSSLREAFVHALETARA